MAINLDERSKQDFLIYANSVIKARAIPSVEDNLKPIHRKILYTLYEEKVTPDKKTKKCATLAGAALKYSPHGDASVYGAMVRMAQWWKLRYPLIEMQGNCGNILGDSAAASRYTECRLSPIGMLMLEGLNQNCVDFKPNYDNTEQEPVVLPSKFPFLLCGNNSGIAVGMSSDLVSHNFHEVADAIKYYINNKDNCSIADLMKFIKGPDFPTGGQIINGDELLDIYSRGKGAVKVCAHYDVIKQGTRTLLVFHDLPYGVEIDSGVKAPLKKLVLEDGYDVFEDIDVKKAGPRNFDITITLGKNADVAKCLEILFSKTRLCDSVKINQTVIIDGEPRVLNLKQLVEYWVNYRSSIVKRIAFNDYGKTKHKLTVTLGLQKCMSDIDKLVTLIRNASNRAAAKSAIMTAFELNDEQAEAVLDMKLSKLSRLDLEELNDTEKELEETLAKLKERIDDESVRYQVILNELEEMKSLIKDDNRLTEIVYRKPVENIDQPLIKQEWLIYPDGLGAAKLSGNGNTVDSGLVDIVMAYSPEEIWGYTADGEMSPITAPGGSLIGGFRKDKTKLVTVTANGNIKVSDVNEYKWKRTEKVMKLKEGDRLVFAGTANDTDFVILFNGERVLKLAVKDLPLASKLTIGVKSGFTTILSASIASAGDVLLMVTKDNKGKFTSINDFQEDSRGNKGQSIAENTVICRVFEQGREQFYCIPKVGKPFTINKNKITIKSKTAIGASISTKALERTI